MATLIDTPSSMLCYDELSVVLSFLEWPVILRISTVARIWHRCMVRVSRRSPTDVERKLRCCVRPGQRIPSWVVDSPNITVLLKGLDAAQRCSIAHHFVKRGDAAAVRLVCGSVPAEERLRMVLSDVNATVVRALVNQPIARGVLSRMQPQLVRRYLKAVRFGWDADLANELRLLISKDQRAQLDYVAAGVPRDGMRLTETTWHWPILLDKPLFLDQVIAAAPGEYKVNDIWSAVFSADAVEFLVAVYARYPRRFEPYWKDTLDAMGGAGVDRLLSLITTQDSNELLLRMLRGPHHDRVLIKMAELGADCVWAELSFMLESGRRRDLVLRLAEMGYVPSASPSAKAMYTVHFMRYHELRRYVTSVKGTVRAQSEVVRALPRYVLRLMMVSDVDEDEMRMLQTELDKRDAEPVYML